MIVRKGSLLGTYSKPLVPAPQKKKLGELILQAELVVSISKRNADLFGDVRVAVIQHSLLSVFIFPLQGDTTLAFALDGTPVGEHGYEKLTNSMFDLIRKTDSNL